MTSLLFRVLRRACAVLVLATLAPAAPAQPATDAKIALPAATETKADAPPPADGALAPLAWLSGCFRGTANQREFREHWMPLRGELLVGASHTVAQGRTQDVSHLRIEPRADGVFYVVTPTRQPEIVFRLTSQDSDGPDRIFTFTSAASAFPQRLVYRRASEGWLYVHVEGSVGSEARRIIYPMRRVDCESGEFILR